MPELPEVEIHARKLREWLVGKRITGCEVLDHRLFVGGEASVWDAVVAGRKVEAVRRQAKYLLIDLEGESALVIHLRMTGKLVLDRYVAAPPGKFTRFTLQVEDGCRVRFEDFRRFGRTWVLPDRHGELPTELAALGPDALLEPTSAERLTALVRGSRRSIKALLMDQRLIGGLGNICAIEILYRAGIAPDTPAGLLNDEQIVRIAGIIPPYLEWAIEAQCHGELIYLGEPGAENVFSIYARAGEPCAKCGEVIRRSVIAGRGTYFCPGCQR